MTTEQTSVETKVVETKVVEQKKEKPHVFTNSKLTSKYAKQTGICNWRVKITKARPHVLELSWWQSGPYTSDSKIGYGVYSGAKSRTWSYFREYKTDVKAIVYVKTADSWIVEDTNGNFYRCGWANACCKHRSEVTTLIDRAIVARFPDQ